MQCPQCQHENREGAKFCNECGAKLEAACPQCGHLNPPGSRYCDECGARVGQPSPAPPAASAGRPAPDTYTPQHLAERILTSRAALEGERKQVTVLFADLKGSMELLADRDPEEARAILDPVLERMMEAVHRYEGTVNQVMGDGIMALFGAPLAHEDHAVRACYAALRMQEVVKQYADEVRRAEGITPQIRVGLNSGEVVVRSIGSDLRMDYTAVGQTTHLAARMEQLATPGSILLAPNTLQLAEGYVQVQALGPMSVKGLSEPVEVYELAGAGTARSRLQAAAARGLTKFVGREAELELLRRSLEQAGSGRGQIVALVGEPGVGKSRLVWEFSHSHRMRGWLVLESRSFSYGKATPYLPVLDLLRGYCEIEARDDPRRVREKLTGKVLTLDEALRPILPALLALLDVPVEDPTWAALDPPQRRQRTLDALKRLLLRESQVQPLLLVFEDLHWIDTETQALLDSLVESLPTARLLQLVNYRPEYEHHWGSKTYYAQLRLDPLPSESAEELLQALLGDAASSEALSQLLIERTEGNPFFLEESVRSLVESGVLAGERGAYRLARPLTPTQVPATVQAVLAARIDRLLLEDKRLLQAAAVIGKDVRFRLLHAIAELPDGAVRQGLARLQAAEFLYETSLFPDLEYTFKHALTHEVTYGSLLHDRRRALHAQIVQAIETRYADRLTEQVERLAHHAMRGEVWGKAATYLHQAGRKAAARSIHPEAVAYYEQALVAVEHLPEGRDTTERAIDLRLDLRPSLNSLGELDRAYSRLREAEALARLVGDQYRLGRACALLSSASLGVGQNEQAVECGQRALAIGTALADFNLQVAARFGLGQAFGALGDYSQAVEYLTRNVELLQGDLLYERLGGTALYSVASRIALLFCLAPRGEFASASSLGEEALRIAETVDYPFDIAMARYGIGLVDVTKGNVEGAIASLQRAQDVCQTRAIRFLLPWITRELGHAQLLIGDVPEALSYLDEAAGQAASIGWRYADSLLIAYQSQGQLLAGNLDIASALGEQAWDLAQHRGERGNEAHGLWLLGEIAAYPDPPGLEQAEARYHQSQVLAKALGMRPLAAHCHLGLGTLYRKIGRDEQAQAELTTAAEMYRAMEMAFWLARAETELGQIASAP